MTQSYPAGEYVMSEKTEANLALALAAESKAAARYTAFAQKADHGGDPSMAHLFRALSESKSVQARRYLLLLRGKIGTSRENLESALALERQAYEEGYPGMIREAEEEGMKTAHLVFSQTREVEPVQTTLIEKALAEGETPTHGDYYICQVCGYISENRVPEKCPICGAIPGKFKRVI
jgi:rubrerythrin